MILRDGQGGRRRGGRAREGQRGLHVERRFDHGGDEAGGHVPFDVAVEEPDTYICACVRGRCTLWIGT